MQQTLRTPPIFLSGVLVAFFAGTASPEESVPAENNLRGTHIPNTISAEARDILKRSKGDILRNYLLDQAGNFALTTQYRAAVPDLNIEETELGGVKAFWFSSQKASNTNAVVVYFHGGGYTKGTAQIGGGFILPVYEQLRIRGLSVEYRLAPTHPFPAAVEDGKNVFLALLQRGYRPDQIALTGDSAGGGLALAVTLALKSEQKPLPAAIAVISPWVDLTGAGDSKTTLASSDPFVTLEMAATDSQHYAGSQSKDHPWISPVCADLEGFPPLLIQVGTREMLLSDAVRLARAARPKASRRHLGRLGRHVAFMAHDLAESARGPGGL